MTTGCKLLGTDERDLKIAASLLSAGELVAAPTETVYGLAANALNVKACRKIFEIKGRPLIDPLIVHFKDLAASERFVDWNEAARHIAARYWPGPLTLILPKKPIIPDIVTAGLSSVAIRVPAHPVFHQLLERLDFPLAAPSANPFGYLSPTRADHVAHTLGDRIKAIVDAGPCIHGIESTILDMRDPENPSILRPGPIDAGSVADTLNIDPGQLARPVEQDDCSAQSAPGMLTKHYSPNARIELIPTGTVDPDMLNRADAGTPLVLKTKPDEPITPHTYWLSEDGGLPESAQTLFELLYRLDKTETEVIRIEMVENTGIGIAINDRLQRAAAKRS